MFELHRSLSALSFDGVCARVQFGVLGGVLGCALRSPLWLRSGLCLRIFGSLPELALRSVSRSQYGAFAFSHERFCLRDVDSETLSKTAHERYSGFVVDAEVGGGEF